MDDSSIVTQLAGAFELGEPLASAKVADGNSPVFRLRTSRGTFLIKSADRTPTGWPELYHRVEQTLNAHGVRQARILSTLGGTFVSHEGYLAFEWLPGRTVDLPSPEQFADHVEHLAHYNRALRRVPLTAEEISRLTVPKDIWSRAACLDYMIDQFRLDPLGLGLTDETTAIVLRVLSVLGQWRPRLAHLPRQLVHSDIGPGNILFDGDRVVSIIDFTPACESHLYALCMSLFWHCVFGQSEPEARQRIAAAASLYVRCHDTSAEERCCFFPLLLKSAAFRVFARLLARAESGLDREAPPFHPGSTERMVGCVERILGWEELLTNPSAT